MSDTSRIVLKNNKNLKLPPGDYIFKIIDTINDTTYVEIVESNFSDGTPVEIYEDIG